MPMNAGFRFISFILIIFIGWNMNLLFEWWTKL